MSLHQSNKRPLRASKLVSYEEKYHLPHYVHVDKAIINPVHEYKDPRVEQVIPDLTLKSKKQPIQDKNKTLKESLPQHLETPFIYVASPPKDEKPKIRATWAPALQWKSFRKTQTASGPAELAEASKEEREAFYQKNQDLKEFVLEFFEEVERCYLKKTSEISLSVGSKADTMKETEANMKKLYKAFKLKSQEKVQQHFLKKKPEHEERKSGFSTYLEHSAVTLIKDSDSSLPLGVPDYHCFIEFLSWMGMDTGLFRDQIKRFYKTFKAQEEFFSFIKFKDHLCAAQKLLPNAVSDFYKTILQLIPKNKEEKNYGTTSSSDGDLHDLFVDFMEKKQWYLGQKKRKF